MERVITYFSEWDFARWFRFAAAIFLFAGAAIEWHFLPVLIGGIFLYQSLTNTGCCNGGNCEIPSTPKSKLKVKN